MGPGGELALLAATTWCPSCPSLTSCLASVSRSGLLDVQCTRVSAAGSVLLCVRVEGVCVCLLLDVAVSTAWLVSVYCRVFW